MAKKAAVSPDKPIRPAECAAWQAGIGRFITELETNLAVMQRQKDALELAKTDARVAAIKAVRRTSPVPLRAVSVPAIDIDHYLDMYERDHQAGGGWFTIPRALVRRPAEPTSYASVVKFAKYTLAELQALYTKLGKPKCAVKNGDITRTLIDFKVAKEAISATIAQFNAEHAEATSGQRIQTTKKADALRFPTPPDRVAAPPTRLTRKQLHETDTRHPTAPDRPAAQPPRRALPLKKQTRFPTPPPDELSRPLAATKPRAATPAVRAASTHPDMRQLIGLLRSELKTSEVTKEKKQAELATDVKRHVSASLQLYSDMVWNGKSLVKSSSGLPLQGPWTHPKIRRHLSHENVYTLLSEKDKHTFQLQMTNVVVLADKILRALDADKNADKNRLDDARYQVTDTKNYFVELMDYMTRPPPAAHQREQSEKSEQLPRTGPSGETRPPTEAQIKHTEAIREKIIEWLDETLHSYSNLQIVNGGLQTYLGHPVSFNIGHAGIFNQQALKDAMTNDMTPIEKENYAREITAILDNLNTIRYGKHTPTAGKEILEIQTFLSTVLEHIAPQQHNAIMMKKAVHTRHRAQTPEEKEKARLRAFLRHLLDLWKSIEVRENNLVYDDGTPVDDPVTYYPYETITKYTISNLRDNMNANTLYILGELLKKLEPMKTRPHIAKIIKIITHWQQWLSGPVQSEADGLVDTMTHILNSAVELHLDEGVLVYVNGKELPRLSQAVALNGTRHAAAMKNTIHDTWDRVSRLADKQANFKAAYKKYLVNLIIYLGGSTATADAALRASAEAFLDGPTRP